MVIRTAAAAGLLCARRELRHVWRNIDRGHIHIIFILRLGLGPEMPEQRNQDDQRKDAAMQGKRNHLCPAEVFVFRPDILHFYWLAGEVRWWKLGREKSLFEARAKSAEVRAPGYCQAAVHRAFRHRTRAEEVSEIVHHPRAKRRFHKRRAGSV